MVAAIGIDINTFTPAVAPLSVSVVIAPKVDYAHDHGYGFLQHCFLSTVIKTLDITAYSTRRQVQTPKESGQHYPKGWKQIAYSSPALGKTSMQTSKKLSYLLYITRKRQACTFVRPRKAASAKRTCTTFVLISLVSRCALIHGYRDILLRARRVKLLMTVCKVECRTLKSYLSVCL